MTFEVSGNCPSVLLGVSVALDYPGLIKKREKKKEKRFGKQERREVCVPKTEGGLTS